MKKVFISLLAGISIFLTLFFVFALPKIKYYEAEHIVKKLEMFKKDKGDYPISLEVLKPYYLSQIYFKFNYEKGRKGFYSLFYTDREPLLGLKSTYYWNCNPVDGCYTDFAD